LLRESPALTIIELLQRDGAEVSNPDPYRPLIGQVCKCDLHMNWVEAEGLRTFNGVLIVTDRLATTIAASSKTPS
jgi:UDP-N-acetyl-D-glucosamine dehydrogenase